MPQVIGVRFKKAGKIYYFDPIKINFSVGDNVIVETTKGIECGEIAIANKNISSSKLTHKLKKVIRKADKGDLDKLADNKKREKKAFSICKQKISDYNLDMNLIDVEYTFDKSKILFYFTSAGRVDFRELVKCLASIFRTRIELRQIGVRDEAKLLGGLGICGRPFCCNTFLGDFQPVSIKMAKEQGLSLNPVKISGTCGRLMCCLKYEQDVYENLMSVMPKIGSIVKTPDGTGTVLDYNLLSSSLFIHLDDFPEAAPKQFNLKDVKVLKRTKNS